MTIFGSKKKSEKKPRGYKKRSREQQKNIRFISHVYKYSIQIKIRTDFQ